jgi:hypothetical protein
MTHENILIMYRPVESSSPRAVRIKFRRQLRGQCRTRRYPARQYVIHRNDAKILRTFHELWVRIVRWNMFRCQDIENETCGHNIFRIVYPVETHWPGTDKSSLRRTTRQNVPVKCSSLTSQWTYRCKIMKCIGDSFDRRFISEDVQFCEGATKRVTNLFLP